MNTFRQRKSAWLSGSLLAVVVLAASVLSGCTDLDEEVFSAVTPENFFQTEEEIIAAVAPVYAQLRNMMWAYHNISQVSSDETVVPTRGTDWDDAGRWRAMHQHTWDPLLVDLNDAWVDAFTGVARANSVLAELDPTENAQLIAELRFLRAFYYYQLLDFFGGVPIVTDAAVDPDNPPTRATRAEVFNFIESELQAVRAELPQEWDSSNYGRATQGAADALLAKLYINAPVFTAQVTAGGLTGGTARWQDAIDAVDRVLNSGVYSLATEWDQNFAIENQFSPEIIFPVLHLATDGRGLTFNMRTLHYKQPSALGGPAVEAWNGFATLAEVYNSFDDDDARKDVFLVGQQFDVNGNPLTERDGETPLFYTPEFTEQDPDGDLQRSDDLLGITESGGVRVLKWEFDPNLDNGHFGNDYAFFRLAEMYLIKAEALNELGRTGEAIALIETVRDRVWDEDVSVSGQAEVRDLILAERQREMLFEATRRQDMIRNEVVTGNPTWTGTWEYKNESAPFRMVFPIPQVQRDANVNLTQNPGYAGG